MSSAAETIFPSPIDKSYRVGDLPIGGMLDHTLYLVRDRFWFIIAAIALFDLPFNILGLLFAYWMGLQQIGSTEMYETDAVLTVYMVWGFSTATSTLVVMPLLVGTIIHGVATHYSGAPSTFGESVRHAVRHWFYFAVAHILYTLAVMAGSMLCLIPGIFLTFYWILFQPVIVLESRGPVQSFQRAGELIWGSMAIAFVLYLCVSLLGTPISMFSLLFPTQFGQFVAANFAGGISAAFNAVLLTVIYCSLRAKKENLDLDLMAGKLASRAPEAPIL